MPIRPGAGRSCSSHRRSGNSIEGTREVLGVALRLDAEPFTVVGVMGQDFLSRIVRRHLDAVARSPDRDSGVVKRQRQMFGAITQLRTCVKVNQASAEAPARAQSAPQAARGDRRLRQLRPGANDPRARPRRRDPGSTTRAARLACGVALLLGPQWPTSRTCNWHELVPAPRARIRSALGATSRPLHDSSWSKRRRRPC